MKLRMVLSKGLLFVAAVTILLNAGCKKEHENYHDNAVGKCFRMLLDKSGNIAGPVYSLQVVEAPDGTLLKNNKLGFGDENFFNAHEEYLKANLGTILNIKILEIKYIQNEYGPGGGFRGYVITKLDFCK